MHGTNAQTERKSGEYGTVEYHAKPASPKPHRKATKPSARVAGTVITAQAAAPSAAKRAKREQIERQQEKPARKPRKGNPRWCEYMGYMHSQDKYGIKVKVTGIAADTYWLPYSQAARLWEEITGENFSEVI